MFDKTSISFPAMRIRQPIGNFFVGVMSAADVVEISKADVREMRRDLDKYMGIQRRLSPSRVKDLKAYVNTYDATFPTAVLLAIAEENAHWNSKDKLLRLVATKGTPLQNVARIIDGQHRIEGLKAYRGDNFEINVSIFVGADIATQANIFATVNLAQTKVNRSLVYDLYDYEKERSPQKSAHHIVVALDQYKDSPFYHRIKRLGSATAGRVNETLTQAALVESILDFITDDPMKDRDSFLRKLGMIRPTKEELFRRPFRELFQQRKDDQITKILLSYFWAVRDTWPKSWAEPKKRGNVLPKTNGVKALMRFLKPAYLSLVGSEVGRVPERGDFKRLFSRVALRDEDFNVKTFPPGTSGEAALFNLLVNGVFPELKRRQSSLF